MPVKSTVYLEKFIASRATVYAPHQGSFAIDMSLGENPWGSGPRVSAAITSELALLARYPDRNPGALLAAIAEKHQVAPDRLVLGVGVDGLIEDIVRVFIEPQDEVLLATPCFPNMAYATAIAGGVPIFCRRTANFHVDYDRLQQRLSSRTKLVFICNPNNPSGVWEAPEDILQFAQRTPAIVVVDEANIEFSLESVVSLARDVENLIVLRSFSKGYGLAGCRIGYAICSPVVAHYIRKLKPPFQVSRLSIAAAIAALQDDDHLLTSKLKMTLEQEFLRTGLESQGFQTIQSQSNYVLVKVTPPFNSATDLIQQLNQRDCSAINGAHFPDLGSDYIRIAPRTHAINQRFLDIMNQVLKQIKVCI